MNNRELRMPMCFADFVKFVMCLLVLSTVHVVAFSQEKALGKELFSSPRNDKISKLFGDAAATLSIDDPNAEIYRITIIPTFYKPIRIRVEKRRNAYILTAKRLSGKGGYKAGKLETEKRRRLSSREWERLHELLRTVDFWQMPDRDEDTTPEKEGEISVLVCMDGADWVIEGVKNGRYRAVNRYCPDDMNFVAIGLYLAELSGLKVKERELF
jgi:hypothetical protein